MNNIIILINNFRMFFITDSTVLTIRRTNQETSFRNLIHQDGCHLGRWCIALVSLSGCKPRNLDVEDSRHQKVMWQSLLCILFLVRNNGYQSDLVYSLHQRMSSNYYNT
mgnify:CR=1 FL=1